MSQKLQELTETLYRQGVEKARAEAETILRDAETQKAAMLDDAEKQAAAIIEQGRKDADALKDKGRAELAMAGKQAMATVKQELTNLLSHNLLSQGLMETLNDREFLASLIASLASTWKDQDRPLELRVVLSNTLEKDFDKFLKKALGGKMDQGLVLDFSPRVKAGFKVEATDGSYQLSFTDGDFQEFFASFVKERTRALLFNRA